MERKICSYALILFLFCFPCYAGQKVTGDLEVTGSVKISGGSPAAGKVLTASDNTGVSSWGAIAAPDLSGYVPYTGASGSVNLGTQNLTTTGDITGVIKGGVGSKFYGDVVFEHPTDESRKISWYDTEESTEVSFLQSSQGESSFYLKTILSDFFFDVFEQILIRIDGNTVFRAGNDSINVYRTLKTSGGIEGKITTVTNTYTVLVTDETVVCNKATAFTVTLPTAVVGQIFTIKNIGDGLVTVDGAGSDTIDGEDNYSLWKYESIKVQCIAANTWSVV